MQVFYSAKQIGLAQQALQNWAIMIIYKITPLANEIFLSKEKLLKAHLKREMFK
jgi:hypothetical protein